MQPRLFAAATVAAPFGVKGFVKLASHSGEWEHLAALDEYLLSRDGQEKSYKIDEIRAHGDGLIVKFAGIDSPEAAALLKGMQILVDRDHAAPLENGEYYIEDLKGLALEFGGKANATVTDVVEGGGAELLEVSMADGSGKRLIPFRKEFIGEIDTAKGRVELLVHWILE